jgi:Glycosyltransferase 61
MTGSSDRGSIHAIAGSRSLEPSDFAFYGFGELTRDELRKVLRLGIRSDPPMVSVVDDAIFVPNGYGADADRSKLAGGIFKPDGQPIETAQMHRKGGKRFGGQIEPVAVVAERGLDEDIIYLGPLFNHYGRVLLESLARVWHLSEVDPSVKVVFNNANSAQAAHAPWVPKLLSIFGIPSERILSLEEPTRLRRAIVPEPLFEQFYSAHEDMVRPFREVAERVAGDVAMSEQPLYLSRNRLTSRQRPVVGEAELEDLLRDQGFAIAYPETMTIEDQVRLINSHREIFSSLGSASHNILFALGKPRLHLLASRDDIPANYFLCSVLANAPTTFVNCLGSGGRATPNSERLNRRAESFENPEKKRPADPEPGPQAMPQLLEMDRVVQYLSETGFLKNRSANTLQVPSSSAGLQHRYDEAWFYARLRKASATPGSLPADLEGEALDLSAKSWPVSFMLARYYARGRDSARTDALANRFAGLVDEESDDDRLAYYRGDILGMATRISRLCEPETANRIAMILANRFPMESSPREVGTAS